MPPTFLFSLASLLALVLVALCVRRALPVAGGGAALWVMYSQTGQAAFANFAAIWTIIALMFALDGVEFWRPTRRALIALETMTGVGLAVIAAFAVFGSKGVEGAALAIAVTASGLIAIVAWLRFRPGGSEDPAPFP